MAATCLDSHAELVISPSHVAIADDAWGGWATAVTVTSGAVKLKLMLGGSVAAVRRAHLSGSVTALLIGDLHKKSSTACLLGLGCVKHCTSACALSQVKPYLHSTS